MSAGPDNPLTTILAAAGNGDAEARERLWQSVYSELHQMAEAVLAGDGARRAIQPTTLIHEAYLRLVGDGDVAWNSRGHFFSAAARAMRRICVDYARKDRALKRGGGRAVVGNLPGDGGLEARRHEGTEARRDSGDGWDDETIVALDAALAKLEQFDARQAEVIMLRYFAGLTVEQTAAALGLSPRTVEIESRCARAWLHGELTKGR